MYYLFLFFWKVFMRMVNAIDDIDMIFVSLTNVLCEKKKKDE